jgi:ABC-type multidrug transport system ATPase subunit
MNKIILYDKNHTKGLDSATALSLINSLRTLAKHERIIVVLTIHQPSTRIFNQVIYAYI